MSWLLPRRRLALFIGVLLAFGLGAYLTFAPELKTPANLSVQDPALYVPIGLAGLCLVTWFAGWHAVWLIPAATMVLAYGWQELFWNETNGISGMDGIGSRPTDVSFVLLAVVPATVLAAAVRTVLVAALRASARWVEG